MTHAIRMKGVLIALVALSLSAGAAFASTNGLSTATGVSGKTVPVATKPETGSDEDATETPDPQETEATQDTKPADTTDTTDTSSNTNCSTSPVGLTADQLAAMTHGQIVCWAAQQPTPDGFVNHGAWVKSWAMGFGGSQAASKDAAGLAHKGQGKTHKP